MAWHFCGGPCDVEPRLMTLYEFQVVNFNTDSATLANTSFLSPRVKLNVGEAKSAT